jgi:hypothetical protein
MIWPEFELTEHAPFSEAAYLHGTPVPCTADINGSLSNGVQRAARPTDAPPAA